MTGPRLHREHQRKIKGQVLDLSLGTWVPPIPGIASWGDSAAGGAMVPDRSGLVAVGGGHTAGPGDPGKSPAGTGSASSPAGVEVVTGAASWAHVLLGLGKLGGTRLLGFGGAVDPEARPHLHPLPSLLGKLQTQLPSLPPKRGQPQTGATGCRRGL